MSDTKKKSLSSIIFYFLMLLFVASLTSSIFITHYYLTTKNQIIAEAKNNAIEATNKAAQEIDGFLKILHPLVTSIADDLSSGALAYNDVEQRIQNKAANIFGIGVAFAPYAFAPTKKLHAPYFVEKERDQKLLYLETFYDYTSPNTPRYADVEKNGAHFLEPFLDPASNATVAEYAAPFYDPTTKKFAGVVFANHSSAHIQHVIRNFKLGLQGYGYVVSQKGLFVAHPNEALVDQKKTLFEIAQEMDNKELEKVGQEATEGKKGFINHENTVTGQLSWILFEPIPSAQWSMVGVFIKDEIKINTSSIKHLLIVTVFNILCSLCLFLFLCARIYTGTEKRLWFGSIFYTLCSLSAIIFMWYIALYSEFYEEEKVHEDIVYDKTGLIHYIESVGGSAGTDSSMAHGMHSMPGMAGMHEINDQQDQKNSMQHSSPQTEYSDHSSTIATHIDAIESAAAATTNQKESGLEQEIALMINNFDAQVELLEQANQLLQKQTLEQQPDTAPTTTLVKTEAASLPTQQPKHQQPDHISQQEQMMPSHTEHAPSSEQPPMEHQTGMLHGNMTMSTTPKIIQIPTGIYIQTINFEGDFISTIGHIWQRYHHTEHKEVLRTVILPQALKTENWRLNEAYRYQDSDWEVIGWNFHFDLKQKFMYSEYPFDTKTIKIELWPHEFNKGEILLTPDFDSYQVTNPHSLPGVNRNLILPNWYLEKSYFSYKKTDYPTNFGFYIMGPFGTVNQLTKSKFPDLYFNIVANRRLLGPLLLDLFPLIIIMIVLFIALFMARFDKITFSSMLSILSSFFFTVILSHLQFKNKVLTQQIVFFEYFYFILHSLLLIITIISILFYLESTVRFIRYKKMLIPLLLYWPILTSSILTLSIIYFY